MLHRRAQLLIAGYTDDELRRQRRSGRLSTVRPGSYVHAAPPGDAAVRHALAAAATLPLLADGAVASHVTAAVLHGLPVWRTGLSRVHVTRSRRTGGRCGRLVHVHTARLAPDELTELSGGGLAGVVATSPARTVVDLARTVPFEEALVVADAALHLGLVTATELAEALTRAGRWPGAPAARRVIAFADGRSESVGESRSRVAIRLAGLPDPVPQWAVLDPVGRRIARTDFGWPLLRTVGEFDGLVKYGRLVPPGRSVADVVLDEKRREDAIRAQDLAAVRWTWSDLADFAPTAAQLRRRFRPP